MEEAKIRVEVIFINSGKSPAINVRYWGRIATSYNPVPVDITIRDFRKITPARLTPSLLRGLNVPEPYILPFATDNAVD
jgi:hypothetical protein